MRSGERLSLSLDVTAVPARLAGAGRYTLNLASELGRRDDVSLTLLARFDDPQRWSAAVPQAKLEALAPSSRPMRLLWEQTSLRRRLAGLGVDVHHGPHYTMPEGAGLPMAVTLHDTTVFDHPRWHHRSKVALFRRAMRVAAREADVLICVSRSTKERVQELLDPQAPLVVVHHGVDHERFRPDEAEEGADAAMLAQLGVRQPYVAFVGTVEPRKDVAGLVRAFDRIAAAHAGLSLVIAGIEGWAEEDLRRAIEAARHRESILRLGYLPEGGVAALFRQAAAVAYPSREEGFGLPVLEAFACGAPVVTTSGSAMEEFAKGAALLVPPGDERSLAGALDMAVRGDTELEERRRRGLDVAARFTWEACAAAHMDAYRTAVAHFAQRRAASGSRARRGH